MSSEDVGNGEPETETGKGRDGMTTRTKGAAGDLQERVDAAYGSGTSEYVAAVARALRAGRQKPRRRSAREARATAGRIERAGGIRIYSAVVNEALRSVVCGNSREGSGQHEAEQTGRAG